MAISMPIAAHRIAISGCVANQAMKDGMGDFLRLSFESLPPASRFERPGTPERTVRLPRTLRADLALHAGCLPDQDPDAWRGDGRMRMARYSNHMLNVKTSQKSPKSKALASA